MTDAAPAPPARRPLLSRLRVSQWFALLAGILGALVLASIVVGVTTLGNLTEARRLVIGQLDPARVESLRLQTALVDEETGVRGFALTGDESFLRPYRLGRAAERQAFRRLAALFPGDQAAGLQRAVAPLQARIRAWRDGFASPLIAELRRNPGDRAGPARATAGKASFDAVRSLLHMQDGQLAAAQAAGRDRLTSTANRLAVVLGVIAVVLVLATLGIALALRAVVSRPISRLADDARRVAGGDLGRAMGRAGPADVVALSGDVDSMRSRMLSDITEVSDARSALEAQTRDLQRSNSELEQFAYVASHDLQEPLRKVASFCQLLQRRYQGQLDERADQYIEFAVDGAKRMQSLISDLLSFSRIGRVQGELVEVPLDGALAHALENLASRIEETGAQIRADPLPVVRGEPVLLAAVFQNLVGNALKFGGDAPPRVRVTAERRGEDWIVSCSDQGIGIEAQYAERIFAIFQRLHAKEDYEGTGIGLALCRKIIEHHGGRIWLDTEVPSGTTFRFALPVREEPSDT